MINHKMKALPLGSVMPKGWLQNQLRIQADGLTGHLEEHWPDVGEANGWKGGKGDSWERGPYYLDGLVPLAYLLGDEQLITKAKRWIEWTLASQQPNGNMGPLHIETPNLEVSKEQDWWHYMIMLKVLIQYQEATEDPRVIPFIDRFLQYLHVTLPTQPLNGWASARGGELLLVISWMHQQTGAEYLKSLAELVAAQTIDWSDVFEDSPFTRKVDVWDWRAHVVNVAMGIKTPGLLYELTGEDRYKLAVHSGVEQLMQYHGQAHGMFSGDEWLSGTHPSQGVELCAVVEYMFSMEHLSRVFMDGKFGDILEKVAFNALPATITADWHAHQYDQQVNQVLCNVAPRPWVNSHEANVFGLEPNFGCCTANMHQGWPKFASSLWMQTGDTEVGLAAISYAPCKVVAAVGKGAAEKIEFTVAGDYPFRDQVTMEISIPHAKQVYFPLSLRIPGWCKTASVTIAGKQIELKIEEGYATIHRNWQDGEQLILSLPMEATFTRRHFYATNIERGPLLYALPIEIDWRMMKERERFHDYELYPQSAWNYAIVKNTSVEVVEQDIIPYQPFDSSKTPIQLKVKGKRLSNWSMDGNNAATPPLLLKLSEELQAEPEVELILVPYGGAKLRIAEFPVMQR